MRTAKIYKKSLYRGKVFRYFFKLFAANGEEVAITSRDDGKNLFTQKHSCIETLQGTFPEWEIIDETGEV